MGKGNHCFGESIGFKIKITHTFHITGGSLGTHQASYQLSADDRYGDAASAYLFYVGMLGD
jgi:hypothetical protein